MIINTTPAAKAAGSTKATATESTATAATPVLMCE
jgi:hypothetical protein